MSNIWTHCADCFLGPLMQLKACALKTRDIFKTLNLFTVGVIDDENDDALRVSEANILAEYHIKHIS